MNSKKNSSSSTGQPIFSGKLCPKNVTDNENAILCDLCQRWVHIKCNDLNYMDYKYLQGCNKPCYCLSSTNTLFPFGNLNNQNFLNLIGNNNAFTSSKTKNLNSSLLLKTTPDLALLFNQLNNAIPENHSDLGNVIQSKYHDIDELKTKKNFNKENSLSLFHTNSFSSNKNFEELQILLQFTNINFDVIARTAIYSRRHITFAMTSKFGKKFELESTFIEKIKPRKSNIIVGVIYKHPKMDVTDFNNNFLSNLLKKINEEQNKCFF